MNAIIFNNFLNGVNGALIDVLDYYIKIYEYNKDVKLIIINKSQQFMINLKELLTDRYYLDDLDIEKNIIGINKNDLLRYKFDRLLIVDYGTISQIKGLIQISNKSSKIIIISDLHTDDKHYIINSSLYPEGCVSYYGEMPYVYKDYVYTIKMLFDRLKPLTTVQNNIFINAPLAEDFSFISTLDLPRDKDIIFKTPSHKNNLFELFDTYVYFHVNKWFDPRPRLFAECEYYNKEILYYNNFNIKDGSYYRYNDLIQNGIKHRFLTRDDEIIRQFI